MNPIQAPGAGATILAGAAIPNGRRGTTRRYGKKTSCVRRPLARVADDAVGASAVDGAIGVRVCMFGAARGRGRGLDGT